MKRLTKILALLFILTTCGSCKKFIDTQPEDYLTSTNYFETQQQLQLALNAIYSKVADFTLYGREMPRMGLDGDEGFYDVSTELQGVGVYDVATTDPKVAAFWTTCYQGIHRANLLLANIDKPVDISDENRNAIEGETLFLRSYFYLLLVNRFGGVPFLTEATQEARIPKTPAKDIYLHIINDMEIAEGLVKTATSVGSGSRINKSAVRGILARANLYMAGAPINDVSRYAEARKWAKLIIDDAAVGHRLNPDFKQVFINYSSDQYDVKESIWELEFWGNNQGVYKEGGQIGAYNGIRYTAGDPNYGYSLGMVNASGILWNKYANPTSLTSTDLRREWTIAPFSVAGNPAVETARPLTQIYDRDCGKFRRKYEVVMPKDNQYTPINFPVLRYADVLLMFAEADNYVNGEPSAEAYLAINQVRRRGYGLPVSAVAPNVDLSGLDQDSFLTVLQDERSRELAFEGLRKSDLIRWGKFTVNMEAAYTHAVNAGLSSSFNHALRYFRNASARDVLWPIPSYEMGVNSALIQNTGW